MSTKLIKYYTEDIPALIQGGYLLVRSERGVQFYRHPLGFHATVFPIKKVVKVSKGKQKRIEKVKKRQQARGGAKRPTVTKLISPTKKPPKVKGSSVYLKGAWRSVFR